MMNELMMTPLTELPICIVVPKKGEFARLKKPYRPSGTELELRIGRVVDVLNDGRCFGLRFDGYPNVVDIGLSLIESAWPAVECKPAPKRKISGTK